MCKEMPINPNFQNQDFEGQNKFAHLFFEKMESVTNKTNVASGISFETADGSEWYIADITYDFDTRTWSWNNNNLNAIGITIDINGPNQGPNLDYLTNSSITDSSRELRKTDQFCFVISESGIVYPGEDLTRAYLLNPNKLNDKKRDFDCAANINACQAARQPAQ
jgi:hypothetical protein